MKMMHVCNIMERLGRDVGSVEYLNQKKWQQDVITQVIFIFHLP